jgi:peptidoglycan/xylan/chitin deacetylase (PgdA/CDA1 family)
MPPARICFYALTFGALGITAASVNGTPPSPRFILAFSVVYVAAVLCGVFFLRLRVFVDAMVRGPHGAKGVVLTFDDGPDPTTTERTLDALDAAKAKATFFVIARKAEKHPDTVRAIVARGHIVGLHSYAHDRLFALKGARAWRKDLARGARIIEGITGEKPRLFRPPIGHTVPHTARVVRDLGMRIIGWDVGARDGIRAKPADVARRVLDAAHDGSIVLLHDAAERGDHEPAGVAALPAILDGLKKRGIEVVPLSDWM